MLPRLCGVVEASSLDPRSLDRLHLVSTKWVLPLLRVLSGGEHRYTDIETALPGISPRALTDKLRLLADEGLVERDERPGLGRTIRYRLTREGKVLAGAAQDLVDWAEHGPRHR